MSDELARVFAQPSGTFRPPGFSEQTILRRDAASPRAEGPHFAVPPDDPQDVEGEPPTD